MPARTAAERAPAALGQPVDERVVAAGVEEHDPELLRLPELAQEQVERQRLVDQVALALELGIGRDQEVVPLDLDAVAGEVDQRQRRHPRPCGRTRAGRW